MQNNDTIDAPVETPTIEDRLAELKTVESQRDQLAAEVGRMQKVTNDKLAQVKVLLTDNNKLAAKVNHLASVVAQVAVYVVTHKESAAPVRVSAIELKELKEAKIISRDQLAEVLYLIDMAP